ncbi:FKBP-type peptidylprolyl cis-trans isomerase [Cavenderia fasciculata]|uniref:peptidylprolyl isomerase n=1 Tax=Cavenderia fasciculata TaxID=261658 RepID=F4QB12_CACFS|nr:FKBP-type peptidylprolyl cis-trans isomerase [Cavenderia fasciculata]EGG14784.1 FKBP-type peptidylprolyl cis-trans isomerase [Cavenderia fasciculata]|eukprot:XP_004351300.1 FKBP-type peptidylprolyl cis-trans isomerase [Cavenderia fasciculata]
MFWGLEIKKEAVKFTPPYDTHVTGACLAAAAKGTERNILVVKYDGQEYSLCSLVLGKNEHSSLDLIFEEGKEVSFQVLGSGQPIHVTGFFVSQMDANEDDEDDMEDEDEEGLEGLEGSDDDEDEDEELEDDEEIDEELFKQLVAEEAAKQLKRKNATAAAEQPIKKTKAEQAAPVAKPAAAPAKPTASPAKKEAAAAPAKAATPTKNEQPKIVKNPNGLIVQDMIVGSGPEATRGKTVAVKYIGKLTNGKTFDSSLKRTFDFSLGLGEVIKGWDLGVAGMKVGGKRRLTIPSHLGYGAQGAKPDIPPHATLVFDVELCRVGR